VSTCIELWKPAYWLARVVECSRLSHDNNTQIGCVIVTRGEVYVIEGYNHFPPGAPQPQKRPAKYRFIEHAERAAVYKAARFGHALEGATAYVLCLPCCDCARAFIESGITRVVYHKRNITPTNWKQSCAAGKVMLERAGVTLETVDEELGTSILLSGQRIKI
jgi:dCMP deaminase